MENQQKASLDILMADVLEKPTKTTNDIFALLVSFIKATLPVKIEPINEIEQECAVVSDKDVDYEEEINLEPHAEKIAIPLASRKSYPHIEHLSRIFKEHRSKHSFTRHWKKSKLCKSQPMHKSVANKKGIIRVNGVKLKKKIYNHMMHDWQNRRKRGWEIVLDDRELMKFKYE